MVDTPTTTPAEPVDSPDESLTPIQEEALNAFAGNTKGALEPNSPVEEVDAPAVDTPPVPKEDDKPADKPAADDTPPKPEDKPAPTLPAPAVTDPGEFTPNDHSYEITLTDGKTRKISTPEEADALAEELDENPELVNAKLLLEFNRKSLAMDQGLQTDKKTYEDNKKAFDEDTTSRETVAKTAQQIENGVKFLETKGMLPPVDPAIDTPEAGKEWTTTHKDATGVKERLELMKYMADNNDQRKAVGLEPTFDAVGAYYQMKTEQANEADKDADKKDADARKKKGSMVGSPAAHVQSNVAPGEIVGEGGNLNELRTW